MTIEDLEREVEAAALELREAEGVADDLRRKFDAALRRLPRGGKRTRARIETLSRWLRAAEIHAAACRGRQADAREALEMARRSRAA